MVRKQSAIPHPASNSAIRPSAFEMTRQVMLRPHALQRFSRSGAHLVPIHRTACVCHQLLPQWFILQVQVLEQTRIEPIPESMVGLPTTLHNFIELILDCAFHRAQLLLRGPKPASMQRFQHPLAVREQQGAAHVKENKPHILKQVRLLIVLRYGCRRSGQNSTSESAVLLCVLGGCSL